MKLNVPFVFVQLILVSGSLASQECARRNFGPQNIVCVCNASYCDYIGPLIKSGPGKILVWTTSETGLRFAKTSNEFQTAKLNNTADKLMINYGEKFQTINGFGGAFTDSTGINMASLSNRTRDYLLKSYFSEDGIQYNLCRVPIGSTDFSTHAYSYDDGNTDVTLKNFKLSIEDHKYKIPLIKIAQDLSGHRLKLFASAWTAPKWMKTNNAYAGFGFIKNDMYQAWADYFVKFLDAYANEGIEFWGITTGNEPSNALIPFDKINTVGWISSEMGKWIAENLGPSLRKSNHSSIKLMVLDDQIFFLPWFISSIFENNAVQKYVDGVALHWYWNNWFPRDLLTLTHNKFPQKFVLATEACEGSRTDKGVRLGWWSRGEQYAHDIIQDLLHWVTGWVDWNMALNLEGGPTYIKNYVDSPIVVNAGSDEFYKQPMYYILGHFSKFIARGSVRIGVNYKGSLQVVAFKRTDNATVIVILNKKTQQIPIQLVDDTKGAVNLKISAKSITSLIYW